MALQNLQQNKTRLLTPNPFPEQTFVILVRQNSMSFSAMAKMSIEN